MLDLGNDNCHFCIVVQFDLDETAFDLADKTN